MHVQPPPNSFETVREYATVRICPGCGGRIDLGRYGCLRGTATVTCPDCGGRYRLVDLGV